MTADLPAHVLRLDHTPIAPALTILGDAEGLGFIRVGHGSAASELKPYNEHGWRTEAEFAARLESCTICNGSRVCPECGGPCDCTIVTR